MNESLERRFKRKKKELNADPRATPPPVTGPRAHYYGPQGDDETQSEDWPRRPKHPHAGGS